MEVIMAENQASIQRRLDFYKFNEKPQEQARRVFDVLIKEMAAGQKIALLYAANKKQVRQFNRHYRQQTPDLYIPHGSGQAEFFNLFNQLVNQAVLSGQLKFGDIKVLPIATSLSGGENSVGNDVSKEDLDGDIEAVHTALEQEYTVYGFGNANQYLIGGKASKHFYSDSNPLLTIDGVSQGCYVQRKLAQLEMEFSSNNRLPRSGVDEKYSPDHLDVPLNNVRNRLVSITRQYYDEGKTYSSFLQRHGNTGRQRAQVFLAQMLTLNSEEAITAEVLDFLDNSKNGNTFEYSFRTILLKEYFERHESLAEISMDFDKILDDVCPSMGFELI